MPAVGVPRPSPVSILTFILPTDAEHLSQVRVGVKCTETMARALPRRRGSGGGEGYGQMSWHAVVSGALLRPDGCRLERRVWSGFEDRQCSGWKGRQEQRLRAQHEWCIPEIITRKPRVGDGRGRFALDMDARVGNMVKAPWGRRWALGAALRR